MTYSSGRRPLHSAAALAVLTSLSLAGCGLSAGGSGQGSAAAENATLRVGMGVDLQSFDPPNFSLASDFTRLDLVYERLVTLGDDGSPLPGLATEWEQTSDTEWTFTIREGVTFSDGTELDAEDVKVTLERSAQETQGSGYLGVIESVDVIDDYTVKLNLSEPFSGLLNNLSVPVAGIVSATAIEENEGGLSAEPVGTGPFVLKSWDPDELMVLERNEDYWGDKPPVETLEISIIPEASTRFAALQSGDIDIIENPPPSDLGFIRDSGELTELIEPKAQPVFLGFELEEVPDIDVRRAIAMAIDKEAIVRDVLEGVGEPATSGLIPPTLITPADDPINIDHDPEGARKLLEEAGVKDLRLDLVLPTGSYLKDPEVAEVIRAQLEDVGITADLVVQESGTWFTSLLEHETQMYWLGWGITAGDPADFLTRVFHSEAVNNMSGYSESDKDIEELATLPVRTEEREELLNKIQHDIVEENVAVVPIYYATNFYATGPNVEGFHTTKSTLWDLSEVVVKQ